MSADIDIKVSSTVLSHYQNRNSLFFPFSFLLYSFWNIWISIAREYKYSQDAETPKGAVLKGLETHFTCLQKKDGVFALVTTGFACMASQNNIRCHPLSSINLRGQLVHHQSHITQYQIYWRKVVALLGNVAASDYCSWFWQMPCFIKDHFKSLI